MQVENFGIHLHKNGTILYGLKIESIMDRVQDRLSIDNLARVLVDIHEDSSKIMDSLISTCVQFLSTAAAAAASCGTLERPIPLPRPYDLRPNSKRPSLTLQIPEESHGSHMLQRRKEPE